jgi:hypothetical protein
VTAEGEGTIARRRRGRRRSWKVDGDKLGGSAEMEDQPERRGGNEEVENSPTTVRRGFVAR